VRVRRRRGARAGRRAHGPDAAVALVGLLARVQQRVLRDGAATGSLHQLNWLR